MNLWQKPEQTVCAQRVMMSAINGSATQSWKISPQGEVQWHRERALLLFFLLFHWHPPYFPFLFPQLPMGRANFPPSPVFGSIIESALLIFTLYLKTSLWYLLYCLFPLSFWTLGFITISDQMAHSLSCICHRLYKRNGQPERPPELRPKYLNHPLAVGCSTGHNPSSSYSKYTWNNFFPEDWFCLFRLFIHIDVCSMRCNFWFKVRWNLMTDSWALTIEQAGVWAETWCADSASKWCC